jgi:hypothetical protein
MRTEDARRPRDHRTDVAIQVAQTWKSALDLYLRVFE